MAGGEATTADLLIQWVRPLLIILCGIFLFHLPSILYKSKLLFRALCYLIFCNDKSWKKPSDPGLVFQPLLKGDKSKIQSRTVYFVRHGESTWNDTFNKGKHRSEIAFAIGFIPGVIKAVLYELYLMICGKIDSWFYDSPLSYLGLSQVEQLNRFLQKPPSSNDPDGIMISVLRGDPGAPPSKIVCSSLRRAISTLAAGFSDRLSRNVDDKIIVLPSLQEISRNPDTLSITPAYTTVAASWIDRNSSVCDFQQVFTHQVDMSLHSGDKPINSKGLKRMTEFCKYAFKQPERHLIVGGHSIWFRSFFRSFLPYTIDHIAKRRKVVNCGVVAFSLLHANTEKGDRFMIDPSSIKVVYGGFA